ncbi:MAG: 30S ribosomal protein S20 [bacterium]|nr:30S ribosomal protein S20 [bacterium]
MAITKSAKKALRQSERRRVVNREWKDKLKDAVKKAEAEKTAAAVSFAYKIADKSAKKGLIKKNKAARIKSRLSKLLRKK